MAIILLAEDDESLCRFLARSLTKAGHEVTSVMRGDHALPYLETGIYDLLVTDIVMPEMDGIELARRAVASQPNLKVVFITGFAAVALNPRGDAPEGSKVLSKPFHLRELVDEIDRTMAA
ncbi:MAG TPA: response regulator [Alphaproteobacteria bacterium]|nr:two-component system, cell cycle response regulator CpdR [Alphaproteobacteria bacterium]HEX4891623.1 response regulator [Alphaproteobacteria bacterium]